MESECPSHETNAQSFVAPQRGTQARPSSLCLSGGWRPHSRSSRAGNHSRRQRAACLARAGKLAELEPRMNTNKHESEWKFVFIGVHLWFLSGSTIESERMSWT